MKPNRHLNPAVIEVVENQLRDLDKEVVWVHLIGKFRDDQ